MRTHRGKRTWIAMTLGVLSLTQLTYATELKDQISVGEYEITSEDTSVSGTTGTTNSSSLLTSGEDTEENTSSNMTDESTTSGSTNSGSSAEDSDTTGTTTEDSNASDDTTESDSTEDSAASEDLQTTRQEIVDFALQFVGNPYVWGGTSLTNGADCSGFVLSVMANFDISLPRTAAEQYNASEKVELSEVEPGDLIFYGEGISHVALYIGDGKIVHASNSATGIIVSDMDYMTPVAAGTFLTEANSSDELTSGE